MNNQSNEENSKPDFLIQTLILNLNDEDFDKTLEIIKSLYLNNKDDSFLINLFSQIINTVKIRYSMVEILSNFTCSFSNILSLQKDQINKLLDCLIYIFPDNDTYMSESYRLFFLSLLLKASFFEIDSVISLFSKLFHNFSGISRYLTLIFIWFAPEIHENDKEFFHEFHSYFVSNWEFEYTSLVIYNVYTQFDKYKENDWKILRDHRLYDFHQSLASYYIANDLLDEFQSLLSQSKFDLNSHDSPSSYEWRSFLQKCPTYLQIAAFYGSVKCFKYLLINGASLSINDFEGKTIAHFAVAGGNNEIVRILYQSNVSFSGALQVAALFHRNEIFRWIMENNISQLDEFHEVTGYMAFFISFFNWTSLHFASFYNLSKVANILLQRKGIDVNCQTSLDFTPLHFTAIYGAVDVCIHLINYEVDSIHPIDINAVDHNDNTPLHYAAHHGHTEIIKCLLNVDGINVNCKDRNGNTPLHLAALNGHKDAIITLLNFKGIKPTVLNDIFYFPLIHDVLFLFFLYFDTPSDILMNTRFTSLLRYFPLNEELEIVKDT